MMASPEGFFVTKTTSQVEFQPQLVGVMLSAENSLSDSRFGSSGLNLTFEGLLLGASLRRRVKGTDSEPHELGPKHSEDVHEASAHAEGMLLCFCREHG
jgi:hypothetical protein